MRAGWNPTRRNRHAGTKAHGHGENNRLIIPQSWHRLQMYYEKLERHVRVSRLIGDREVIILVEPPRPGRFYPCTPDDVFTLLSHCPPGDVAAFDFIVMRQATRKQRILCPVWGRAIFHFDTTSISGAAVVLEAQTLQCIRWDNSFTPERKRELQRLHDDGHDIRRTRRGIEIHVTPKSLRHTQLYRTLLHEIGHHLDYRRSSDEAWDGKTKATKEDFAHRHAQERFDRLCKQGALPFPRQMEPDRLRQLGLLPEWFTPENDDSLAEATDRLTDSLP